MASTDRHPTWTMSYRRRASLPSTGPLAAYLLRLMSIKQSNLCLSADVLTSAELIELAETLGDEICILKTHCDIVTDWTERTALALKEIARRKHFVIFEDRKFADIGGTVQKQYTSGYHRIATWSEITNAHILPGPAIVTALHKAATETIVKYNTAVHTEISADRPISTVDDDDEHDGTNGDVAVESPRGEDDDEQSISPRPEIDLTPEEHFNIDTQTMLQRLGPIPFLRSLLLLAEMSSEGHLLTPEYSKRCVEIARQNSDFVMGFIAQRSLNSKPDDNFLTMTPGCQLPPPEEEGKKLGDGLGQQYNTPRRLVYEQGCDVIIVGRGILNAKDRLETARRYRKEGWAAYLERIGNKSG